MKLLFLTTIQLSIFMTPKLPATGVQKDGGSCRREMAQNWHHLSIPPSPQIG
ncbi:hypothetical protein AB4O99_20730 [Klebsiella pasteurii]|uniref:hypothetical protein n=1 Tax=Klebsiella pasteurii TaxID=2587529 RepID=UPI00287CF13C|nr:hypothetical protein [Klebsiella pasteurii]MDS7871101.1 hypothetical protein [Klebsiella pasteurii]